MWTRVLGADQVVANITLEQWKKFIDERRSGAIDAHGRRVEGEDERQPVRDRTLEADLTWLRLVVGWGARWRDQRGEYLLRENVLRGYPIPREKNPRRPVATTDRYEALMELLAKVERGEGPKSKTGCRLSFGYLAEILPVVAGTGRRLSSVLALRYSDILPERGDHGSIRWRGDHDKGGRESVAYIGPDVRAAIDKALARRPGIGEGWLFAAPRKPAVYVSRSVADKWLRTAEKAAGLETQRGSLWHAYKRARVSAWIDAGFPLTAIGQATGNRDERNLLRAYGHAVDSTVQTMVNTQIEIREANQ